MKNSKSLPLVLFVTIVFACVMSCDEQDEKFTAGTKFTNNTSVKTTKGRVGAIQLDGSEGDPIALETAQRWTRNFKSGLRTAEEHRAHFFGHEIIEQILKQTGCVGIRMYYAVDDEGQRQIVLVGVDANGDDILPSAGGRIADGDEGIVADASLPCPSYCSSIGL